MELHGAIYTLDRTHTLLSGWIERKPGAVLDQAQISDSTLGEAAKSLCTVGLSATERCDLDATRRGSLHLPKLYSLDCLADEFCELLLYGVLRSPVATDSGTHKG